MGSLKITHPYFCISTPLKRHRPKTRTWYRQQPRVPNWPSTLSALTATQYHTPQKTIKTSPKEVTLVAIECSFSVGSIFQRQKLRREFQEVAQTMVQKEHNWTNSNWWWVLQSGWIRRRLGGIHQGLHRETWQPETLVVFVFFGRFWICII